MFGKSTLASVLLLLATASCLDAAVANVPVGDIGISLFSEPAFDGNNCLIKASDLKEGECVNLPAAIKVKSVKKGLGSKCCILYRAPCPKTPQTSLYSQNIGYLNQRVFADISDLAPYGFADIVRSVVCPSDDVCVGIKMDKDLSPETNFPMGLFWVDIRNIPARRGLGP
ncbi:hypothetical protein B0T26DRAFT_783619 [Lasiosphaeria miniovina]|uniref:Uncharacterized protein n=1 Tax=Lasiosphaeria miniovina TaxID=1954250 RepID=A0AA40DW44_9PEZI|nr:uncharacterized protein B0T26DRAFT_783619 [Lasiosphaeria miniovina]KAK0713913.1 hypothetical protein B0T26DRAFT_783619 [Lasiosphaeria miniovina]